MVGFECTGWWRGSWRHWGLLDAGSKWAVWAFVCFSKEAGLALKVGKIACWTLFVLGCDEGLGGGGGD